MIWKWSDRKDDKFVSFGHQDARIAALERDMQELSEDLLSYVKADMECGWMVSAKRLATTLRKIIDSREK